MKTVEEYPKVSTARVLAVWWGELGKKFAIDGGGPPKPLENVDCPTRNGSNWPVFKPEEKNRVRCGFQSKRVVWEVSSLSKGNSSQQMTVTVQRGLGLSQWQWIGEKKCTLVTGTESITIRLAAPGRLGFRSVAYPCPQTLQQKLGLEGARLLCGLGQD